MSFVTATTGCAESAADGSADWKVETNVQSKTLHLTGRHVVAGRPSFGAAVAFLGAHRGALAMRAPAEELVETATAEDGLGYTRVRMRQTVKGVPVHGAEVSVHYDPAGAIVGVDSTYVAGLEDLDVVPAISAEEAGARALAAQPGTEVQSTKLVVYPPHLSYEVEVRAASGAVHSGATVQIDAQDGAVLAVASRIRRATAEGSGRQTGKRSFEAAAQGAGFVMRDTTRNIETWDAQSSGATTGQDFPAGYTAKVIVQSGALASGWDPTAVTAHSLAERVYDFYKDEYGRRGIDGQGGLVKSVVHVGQPEYGNAFWDGEQMCFGDNTTVVPEKADADPWTTSHELTHGVTQYTSKLLYEGDSGAVNESMSDIMAAAFTNDYYRQEWLALCTSADCFRDVWNPGEKYGDGFDNMKAYVKGGEYHENGAIMNWAANHMAVGGTNPTSGVAVARGFGWKKVGALFYRVETTKLMESSDIPAVAAATVAAAKELGFTTDEQNIVDCAWKAIGVFTGSCKTIAPESAPTAPGDGTATGSPAAPQGDDAPADADTNRDRAPAAIDSSGCAMGGVTGTVGGRGLGAPASALLLACALAARARRRRSGYLAFARRTSSF